MVLQNQKNFISILLISLFTFTLVGCKNDVNSNKLIGTWYGVGNTNIMFVFIDEANCKSGIYDKKTKKKYLSQCTYELENNVLTLSSGDEKEIYKFSFKKDRLILKTEANTELVLKNKRP